MKLKRYIQFIKESIKEQIEEGTLWKLTEDDITDYMLEITDAGYYVSVEFGFSEKSKQYSYKDGKRVETEKDIFTDKPKIDLTIQQPPSEDTVPTLKLKKEVYNIPSNNYTYDDAKVICKAYGAKFSKPFSCIKSVFGKLKIVSTYL